MHPVINIALRAARAASTKLIQASDRPDRITLIENSAERFVTSLDKEVDDILLYELRKMHPDAHITSRLSGSSGAEDAPTRWLLDPLFGGRNFIAGLPAYGISLFCEQQGKASHGVIVLPHSNEEFIASRGDGAHIVLPYSDKAAFVRGGGGQLNRRRLRVGTETELDNALLGVDYTVATDATDELRLHGPMLAELAGLSSKHRGQWRISGCAELDMLATAANRLQGGYCRATGSAAGLQAAQLILQEAGGLIASEQGNPDLSDAIVYVYGNPAIFKQLLRATKTPGTMDALEALHSRVSFPKLKEPAPSDEQLQNICRAALRAADHGMLRPWRFLKIQGAGREKLGELFVAAANANATGADADVDTDTTNPALSAEEAKRLRLKPLRAPLILVVIATPREHPKIPMLEQHLSAAAAAQNILTAAYSQGLGAMWRTGSPAYDDTVKRGLGLTAEEKIVGFIYLGTVDSARKNIDAPELDSFFQEWSG